MKILLIQSIAEISSEAWDLLAPESFPFASYSFLRALETTGCVGDRTGWFPQYFTVWEGAVLNGALLAFVKSNSYGEYIFDFAWADAYARTGLDYYPKVVSAIPFTPATGPKLLIAEALESERRSKVQEILIAALREFVASQKMSSFHALFITEDEKVAFENQGFMIRHSYQYHWKNDRFANFSEFLLRLRSKRRKEILREREQVKMSGVTITRLTGADLKPEHAEIMHRFYTDTVSKRGGFEYLTRRFFHEIFRTLADRILLVLAHNSEGTAVAGALNYYGGATLFGRNWGCLEDYKSLHFELCYYQGIEFAIEKGLKLFEAGAQGEHKFQRGFMPSLTLSAHHFENQALKKPISDFIENEAEGIETLFAEYRAHTPFSRESN